jgi:hypothetical protein
MKHFYVSLLLFCHVFTAAAQQDLRDYLFLHDGEDPQEKISRNLFCKIEANKQVAYTGEPILVTIKLYSALQSTSKVEKSPSFNGFSTYDIREEWKPTPQQINGRTYFCHIIRKLQLYPAEAGSFTLEPVEIKSTVLFYKQSTASIEDIINGKVDATALRTPMEFENITRTPEMKIVVKPAPESNKPATFNGAVGRFTLKLQSDSNTVVQNGALKLRWTLQGSGNFKGINQLPVNWPAGMEAFDPMVTEQIEENKIPFSGSKIFEYTVSPSVAGAVTIPAVAFSFFNTATGSYQTVQSDSMRITVTPGTTNVPEDNYSIRENAPVAESSQPAASFPWAYAGISAVALLTGGFLFWRWRKRKKETNLPAIPVEEEPIVTHVPFREASVLAMLGEEQKFLTALRREFYQEAARSLQLPEETPVKDMLPYLKTEAQRQTLLQFVQQLDGLLYAGGAAAIAPEPLLQEAKQRIASLTA